jgi:hypothetical protein
VFNPPTSHNILSSLVSGTCSEIAGILMKCSPGVILSKAVQIYIYGFEDATPEY